MTCYELAFSGCLSFYMALTRTQKHQSETINNQLTEDAMSFKQFNIYNRVHAPDYTNTGAKSYGTNSFTTTEVVVGTSSRNSHEFLKHETKKIVNDDGTMTFEFWLDDALIKECVYDIKQKKVISNTTLDSTRITTKAVA